MNIQVIDNPYMGLVYQETTATSIAGLGTNVKFDTIAYEYCSPSSFTLNSNSVFTAPVSGIYEIEAGLTAPYIANAITDFWTYNANTSTPITYVGDVFNASLTQTILLSDQVYLPSGTVVQLIALQTSGANVNSSVGTTYDTWFSYELVKRT